MSHYEERLEADRRVLRDLVVKQGEAVRKAMAKATDAYLARDRTAASRIILGDHPINRRARGIDRLCHAFVARHVPGAKHLRFVSAVMRISIALERLGDYAVTVSRETVQLEEVPPKDLAMDIEMMSERGRKVLEQAIEAFRIESADLARGTMALATQKGRTFHRVFTDLRRAGERGTRGIEDLFGILVVLYRMERVADQAKNICEETVFIATGETKKPKVYSVLFVDRANRRGSQMAEAIARKAYPESGRYRSAGWTPAATIDADLAAFLDERGYDVRSNEPSKMEESHDDLTDYHVIVDLDGKARDHMAELPFQTVLVRWEMPEGDTLEAAEKTIRHRVQELMETLRGEDAP